MQKSNSKVIRYCWLLILLLQPIFLFSQESEIPFSELQKGVVQIRVYSQPSDPYSPWEGASIRSSAGTGFLIGGNRILTNAHVVSDAKFIQVQRHNQTEWYPVKVLFIAHDCDLAIIESTDPKFYENGTDLEIGGIPDLNSPLIVIGYPIGGNRLSVTRGIVSRKDHSTYAHSGIDSHLVLQVDAAINPGNSGGPAIQNGKVVGIAFQVATAGENIGYLIPTNVIHRFLEDCKDGKYDGYTELGISTINSFNDSIREAKKIPENLQGVFIINVLAGSSAEGFLKKGDLLVEIDHHTIGRNGLVNIDKDSSDDFVELVDNKHVGEPIQAKVYRDGQTLEFTFPAKVMPELSFMRRQYGIQFRYVMLAGLVFQEMSRDLLSEWGKAGNSSGGSQLVYRFSSFLNSGINRKKKADVVFYRKLDHPINSSANRFQNLVLESVNGKEITSLQDLNTVIQSNKARFLELKFLDLPSPLILDASEVQKADNEIRKTYGLPQ